MSAWQAVKSSSGGYDVVYENGVVCGQFIACDDGFYRYFPCKGRGGFNEADLVGIGAVLKKLNEPIQKDLDNFFRWIELSMTTMSGKTLFVCKDCGRQSSTRDETCPKGCGA